MNKEFTIFMLVKTTPKWLAMTPPQRFGFVDETIKPLLQKYREVTLRFFDVEAFNARVSDVLLWQTKDLMAYQSLVEGLRETPFWDDYFQVLEILPSLEDAYADHYEVEKISA